MGYIEIQRNYYNGRDHYVAYSAKMILNIVLHKKLGKAKSESQGRKKRGHPVTKRFINCLIMSIHQLEFDYF